MPERKVQALEWRAAVESVVTPLVSALREQGWTNTAISALFADVTARAADGARSRADPLGLSYAEATRLIARWRSDAQFSDDGVARPLVRSGSRSFDALARAAKVDARRAQTALQRLGLIRVAAGRVVLRADAYVPTRGLSEKLDILGRDGAEFIRTMLHNVKAPTGRAFLQRKTSYDNIGGEDAQRLMTALCQHGTEALMAADAVLAQADRDRNRRARGGRRTRISFGVYCFTEPVPPRSTSRKKRPASRRRVS